MSPRSPRERRWFGWKGRRSGGGRPARPACRAGQSDHLRRRIGTTRRPSKELVDDRSQGVQLAAAQALARYWLDEYDFGRVEARLNELPQFVTEIDGVGIHFIRVVSSHENALPLIMTHGWPGSVIELLQSVGPQTGPTAHGGSGDDAFHLVLPSLVDKGGHFAAWEEPNVFSAEVRAAFRSLR